MLAFIYLILILGILIFVHELGHFIAAKWAGVYVHEFALGMGPKIFSFKRKNKKDPTLYALRVLPIGGFCAMAGEVDDEAVEDDKGKKIKKSELLCNKTKWQRFIILFAGVFFNLVFALILLFAQSLIWGHNEQRSVVGYAPEYCFEEDSFDMEPVPCPISAAGIEVGDRIIAVNDYKVRTWDKLTIVLNLKNKSETYHFKVEKANGDIKEYEITPIKAKDINGTEHTVFGFGVGDKIYKGFFNGIKFAFVKLGSIVSSMALIIGSLFTGKLGISSLSGPVGMYSIVGETAKYGFASIMYLTAYLSINLGFVNAIPFPAFDGGRIIFVIVEAITKKKVNQNVEGMIHTIGMILLMLLMAYITLMDVLRLF